MGVVLFIKQTCSIWIGEENPFHDGRLFCVEMCDYCSRVMSSKALMIQIEASISDSVLKFKLTHLPLATICDVLWHIKLLLTFVFRILVFLTYDDDDDDDDRQTIQFLVQSEEEEDQPNRFWWLPDFCFSVSSVRWNSQTADLILKDYSSLCIFQGMKFNYFYLFIYFSASVFLQETA